MSGDRYPSVPERITWTSGFHCATCKLVLGFLSTFADFKTGQGARVSLKKLTARSRLKRRTVERALQHLEADGWIRARRWHRHATSWDIVTERLAETWVDVKVVPDRNLTATGGGQLTATCGGQDPDLTATSGGQDHYLTATGGGPIPSTYVPPVVQIPRDPAPSADRPPQQLSFSPMDIGGHAPVPASAAVDVWAAVLRRVETKVNRHTFYTWWRESVLVEDRGGVIVVRAANEREKHEVTAHWIQKHFAGVLADSLAEVRPGTRVEFQFAVRQQSGTMQRKSG